MRRPIRMKSVPCAPKLTVRVLREIMVAATTADSRHCMVADAIAQQVPWATNIIVDLATIRMTDRDRGLRYTYQTPLSVRDGIFTFDDGVIPEEFDFELRNGWVQPSQSGKTAKERIPLEAWRALIAKANELREENGVTLKTLAEEIDAPSVDMTSKYLRGEAFPGPATADKIEAWVIKQTGDAPAKRVRSQAHKAAGPLRVKTYSNRATPTLVGGKAGPRGQRFREFGVRTFSTRRAEKLAKMKGE